MNKLKAALKWLKLAWTVFSLIRKDDVLIKKITNEAKRELDDTDPQLPPVAAADAREDRQLGDGSHKAE